MQMVNIPRTQIFLHLQWKADYFNNETLSLLLTRVYLVAHNAVADVRKKPATLFIWEAFRPQHKHRPIETTREASCAAGWVLYSLQPGAAHMCLSGCVSFRSRGPRVLKGQSVLARVWNTNHMCAAEILRKVDPTWTRRLFFVLPPPLNIHRRPCYMSRWY
jgi:hypothetical protein